jgi:transposase
MKQIKELQRLLAKTMENELLKEAVEYGRAKVDSARPYCPGMGSKLRQPLSPGVACAVARHSQTNR